MLVMSRQRDESFMIGDDIEVIIVDIRGDKVRLGITAPKELAVHRYEIYNAIQCEKELKEQTMAKYCTTYCKVLRRDITDRECYNCWYHGQKEKWLRRQLEEYGRRKRISRRECRLVNLRR